MQIMVALFCMSWLAAGARAPNLGVVVRGDTQCPTSGEVSGALEGLLGRHAPPGAPDLLRLSSASSGSATGLTLVLTNAAGEVVARRELAVDAKSCAELARTAAVIVAAWEARLATGGDPSLPVISSPPSSSLRNIVVGGGGDAGREGVRVAPAPPEGTLPPPGGAEPAELALRPIAELRTEGVPGSRTTTARAPVADGFASDAARNGGIRRAIDIETGAAFLISIASASGSVAPGALAEMTWFRRDAPRAGLGLSVLAVGTHATDLMAPGARARGAWRRFGGVIDLRSRSMGGRTVELDLRLGLALTALAIQGQSLPVTSGATLFDPGVLVGFRLRRRFGQVAPFLELAAAFWPRGHTMYVDGTAISADVPPFEGWLNAGICLFAER